MADATCATPAARRCAPDHQRLRRHAARTRRCARWARREPRETIFSAFPSVRRHAGDVAVELPPQVAVRWPTRDRQRRQPRAARRSTCASPAAPLAHLEPPRLPLCRALRQHLLVAAVERARVDVDRSAPFVLVAAAVLRRSGIPFRSDGGVLLQRVRAATRRRAPPPRPPRPGRRCRPRPRRRRTARGGRGRAGARDRRRRENYGLHYHVRLLRKLWRRDAVALRALVREGGGAHRRPPPSRRPSRAVGAAAKGPVNVVAARTVQPRWPGTRCRMRLRPAERSTSRASRTTRIATSTTSRASRVRARRRRRRSSTSRPPRHAFAGPRAAYSNQQASAAAATYARVLHAAVLGRGDRDMRLALVAHQGDHPPPSAAGRRAIWAAQALLLLHCMAPRAAPGSIPRRRPPIPAVAYRLELAAARRTPPTARRAVRVDDDACRRRRRRVEADVREAEPAQAEAARGAPRR